MKRAFKTIFCVLTICAMVSFIPGCGGGDDAGKKGNDTTQKEGGADKGADKK